MRAAVARQWALISFVRQFKHGVTIAQIMAHTGAPRSTTYRDIALLGDAGVPFDRQLVNGEARYSLAMEALPPLGPTATQLAALRLARTVLTGLDGAGPVAELDQLLASYAGRGFGAGPDGRLVGQQVADITLRETWCRSGSQLGLSRDQAQLRELAGEARMLPELMAPSGRTNRTKFRNQCCVRSSHPGCSK